MAERGRMTRTQLGPVFSEGARRLWQKIVEEGWTQAHLAERIGEKAPTVHAWLYGYRKPQLGSALNMAKKLRIPAGTWTEPPAEPFEPPATDAAEDVA